MDKIEILVAKNDAKVKIKGAFSVETKENNNSDKKDKNISKSDGKKELDFLEIKPEGNNFVIGLGKKSEFSRDKIRKAVAICAKRMKYEQVSEFSIDFYSVAVKEKCDLVEIGQVVAEGAILSTYEFDKYKSDKKKEIKTSKIILLIKDSKNIKAINDLKKGISRGTIIANNINYTRNLINEPPAVVTPAVLASEALKLKKLSNKINVKVFGKKELEKMGMNCLLSVSYGSVQEPKFIVVEYNPNNSKSEKPIVLVGKGITYDSGGLSLKPAQSMENMKTDMAGAATVISAIKTVVEIGVKKKVFAIIPTCENMVGPSSFKVDDIIKAYNGLTIEVKNTDAEGRLILCDALAYADKNYDAKCIIDIATLTGAAIIALGYEITALIGTNDELKKKLLDSAKNADEYMWELPIIEEYKGFVKGEISDLTNMARDPMNPGTIVGGIFLSNFVKKAPYAHLDIGGTGRATADSAYKKKGGTAICLKTFVDFIEKN